MSRMNEEERKAYNKEYYQKNIDKFKEYKKKNKDKISAYFKERWAKNKNDEEFRKKEKARTLAWYHKHFHEYKEIKYARDKEWRSRNKGIINFHTNKRYTVRKQRLPKWLTEENLKQIQVMYTLASSLTKKTGITWHVDHIIPLQGKTVSGLHVPENLQVIPGSLNNKKSNKFEDADG
jgi:hypothetical protein